MSSLITKGFGEGNNIVIMGLGRVEELVEKVVGMAEMIFGDMISIDVSSSEISVDIDSRDY